MHDVLDYRELLGDEWHQAQEEGRDVAALAQQVQALQHHGSPEACMALIDALAAAPRRIDWPYVEPTTLADIQASRQPLPGSDGIVHQPLVPAVLREQILGAWLGRCAGCNLGKPVEGWQRAEIRTYLDAAQAYPLTDYLPRLDPLPTGYIDWTPEVIPWGGGYTVMNASWPTTTRGHVDGMARDDDTDYTILGLHILETYGFDFRTEDVAETWLHRLPFLEIYTAERAAYRNLIDRLSPPATALLRNPYREWIGAQIRADMWGYVHPGDPAAAAAMAYRDAALSHVQNGVYGEMWAAALIAAAFTAPTMSVALAAAMAQIPAQSRLAEALRDVFSLFAQGLDWETARDALETRYYARYSFVHTVNNAALVAMALLWGEGDYTKTIAYAVQGGWDTDCNGATAGSAFGAMHGTDAIPEHWINPLNNTIRSALAGFDQSRITDLAERTFTLAISRQADKVATAVAMEPVHHTRDI